MIEGIAFGDVFTYQGEHYVYFAESPDDNIIYAGKILDDSNTKQLQVMYKAIEKRGTNLSDAPMFSYVVLKTADFKHRAVLCAVRDENIQLSTPIHALEQEDIDGIRQEIKDRPGFTKLKQILDLLD